MPKRQKIPTPLDYVHFLAGLPAPIEEEDDSMGIPVPTPVWMPQPQHLDPAAMGGGGIMGGGQQQQQQPYLPPPVAMEAPPGFQGQGGMYSPDSGAFG